MWKVLTIISFMFIVNTVWAARLSCGACGSDCVSACGTRRFRTCCFNYLRKKRGPEAVKFYTPDQHLKESQSSSKLPFVFEDNSAMPEQWIINMPPNNTHPYPAGENSENHYYDA